MKKRFFYIISMILALNISVLAQDIVSEISKLSNGEIPAIVVNPVDVKDKVKEIEIYPFINNKAKVVIRVESESSRLNYTSISKSGFIEVISSSSI